MKQLSSCFDQQKQTESGYNIFDPRLGPPSGTTTGPCRLCGKFSLLGSLWEARPHSALTTLYGYCPHPYVEHNCLTVNSFIALTNHSKLCIICIEEEHMPQFRKYSYICHRSLNSVRNLNTPGSHKI